MAFSYTTKGEVVIGSRRMLYGTYSNSGGSTGGDITPGYNSSGPEWQALSRIENVNLQPVAAAVVASQHVVNTTLPASAVKFTTVTGANENGVWTAIGY